MPKMPPLQGELTLPSRLQEIRRAEQVVLQAITAHGFGEHDRFAIKLALEEALSNAIKHGNSGDPDRTVKVEYAIEPEMVRICVEDEGCGFNPGALPDPTLDENLRKADGRGVMLMRTYMDEVCFNSSGNRVTLLRRRTVTGARVSGRESSPSAEG